MRYFLARSGCNCFKVICYRMSSQRSVVRDRAAVYMLRGSTNHSEVNTDIIYLLCNGVMDITGSEESHCDAVCLHMAYKHESSGGKAAQPGTAVWEGLGEQRGRTTPSDSNVTAEWWVIEQFVNTMWVCPSLKVQWRIVIPTNIAPRCWSKATPTPRPANCIVHGGCLARGYVLSRDRMPCSSSLALDTASQQRGACCPSLVPPCRSRKGLLCSLLCQTQSPWWRPGQPRLGTVLCQRVHRRASHSPMSKRSSRAVLRHTPVDCSARAHLTTAGEGERSAPTPRAENGRLQWNRTTLTTWPSVSEQMLFSSGSFFSTTPFPSLQTKKAMVFSLLMAMLTQLALNVSGYYIQYPHTKFRVILK